MNRSKLLVDLFAIFLTLRINLFKAQFFTSVETGKTFLLLYQIRKLEKLFFFRLTLLTTVPCSIPYTIQTLKRDFSWDFAPIL